MSASLDEWANHARLGAHLRTIREKLGHTQAQCAAALGIPRSAYTLIEQGVRKISLLEGEVLAACFGVRLAALLPRRAKHVANPPQV